MNQQQKDMISSLYAIRAILAKDRGRLTEKYHCGIVKDEEWLELSMQELFLQVILDSVVRTQQPGNAFIQFLWEGNPDTPVNFSIGGNIVSTQTAEGDSVAFLDAVAADINTYLASEGILGRAYRKGSDKIKVVADIANDTVFAASLGVPATGTKLFVESSQDFKGRYDIGCVRSHCCNDNSGLEYIYRTLVSAIKDSPCCSEEIVVYRLLGTCDPNGGDNDDRVTLALPLSGNKLFPYALVESVLYPGEYTWEITIKDENGDDVTGYPITGDQTNLPAEVIIDANAPGSVSTGGGGGGGTAGRQFDDSFDTSFA